MTFHSSNPLDRNKLAAAYAADVEHLIAANRIDEALSQLQDSIQNLAPTLKNAAILIRRRHAELRQALINGTVDSSTREAFYNQILLLNDEVRRQSTQSEQDHTTTLQLPEPNIEPSERSATGRTNDIDLQLHRYWQEFRHARPIQETTAVFSENLSVDYGQFRLKPISLRLQYGQIMGVVGKNASGKTTLLSLLAGRLSPSSGRVQYPRLFDNDSDWPRARRKIAYIPQFPTEWPGTVGLNLQYIAAVHGRRGNENLSRVDWYVERFGLSQHLNYSFYSLSGGYRMRYELVKALLSNPSVVIMDEPLAALDLDARIKFLQGLRAIAYSVVDSIPIVVSSQHIDEVEAIADQILVLENGDTLYLGPTSSIGSELEYLHFEVTTSLPLEEVSSVASRYNLVVVDQVIDGYIVRTPKSEERAVFDRVYQAFKGNLTGLRNITNSARSLLSKR